MICRNCGGENAANESVCENCGATIARRTLASPVATLGAAVAGFIAGILLTGCLWYAGAWFREAGVIGYGQLSRGSAWFYFATLLATCAALIVLFRRPLVEQMNVNLRAFLLVVLFVTLGGMSVCNLFSARFLFPRT